MTMNCHLLVCLADSVRWNGPLFAVDCFVFEDLNGYLIKYVHGTQGVASQLITSIMKMQTVPVMKDLYLDQSTDSLLQDLYKGLMEPDHNPQTFLLEDGIEQIGSTSPKLLCDDEMMIVSCQATVTSNEDKEFHKVQLNKMVLCVHFTIHIWKVPGSECG